MVIKDKGFEVIGPEITDGVREILVFIMKKESVTTSMVADEFDLTVQNASGRLKKMLDQGLLLGSKENAESGGHEYRFKAIK